MTDLCPDYLVIGSGAVGLAFAGTLLAETDTHITILDRRKAAARCCGLRHREARR